jgi:hypothetical protein
MRVPENGEGTDHASIRRNNQLWGVGASARLRQDENAGRSSDLMPLKVLNCSLVFLRCHLCLERSQIPPLSRFWILLSRVQPIFTGLEFPDHVVLMLTLNFPLAGQDLLRIGQAFTRARATLQ